MSDEMQALCFMAGANSMFYGERLLTTDNPEADADVKLFKRLGLQFEESKELQATEKECGNKRERRLAEEFGRAQA